MWVDRVRAAPGVRPVATPSRESGPTMSPIAAFSSLLKSSGPPSKNRPPALPQAPGLVGGVATSARRVWGGRTINL